MRLEEECSPYWCRKRLQPDLPTPKDELSNPKNHLLGVHSRQARHDTMAAKTFEPVTIEMNDKIYAVRILVPKPREMEDVSFRFPPTLEVRGQRNQCIRSRKSDLKASSTTRPCQGVYTGTWPRPSTRRTLHRVESTTPLRLIWFLYF